MFNWKLLGPALLCIVALGCTESPEKIAAKKAAAEAQVLAEAMKKDEADAKAAVLKALKDPDSAKFGQFTVAGNVKGSQTACLTVNAKNSYGGYTGDREAVLGKMEGVWVPMQLGIDIAGRQLTHQECIGMMTPKK